MADATQAQIAAVFAHHVAEGTATPEMEAQLLHYLQRRQPTPTTATDIDTDYMRRLERDLIDQGKLIEAGWVSLRIAAVPTDAPQVQIEEMRQAFFAGAQHLFSSVMTVMDDDREPTEADLKRMDQISDELEGFIQDYSRRHGLTPGAR